MQFSNPETKQLLVIFRLGAAARVLSQVRTVNQNAEERPNAGD